MSPLGGSAAVLVNFFGFWLSAGFHWQTESISEQQDCGQQWHGPWHLWLKSGSVNVPCKEMGPELREWGAAHGVWGWGEMGGFQCPILPTGCEGLG